MTTSAETSLLARLLDAQPLSQLSEIRSQIQADLRNAQQRVSQLSRDLAEVERAIAMRTTMDVVRGKVVEPTTTYQPLPLRRAILTIFREEAVAWNPDALLSELGKRGWAPGGKSPRNTLVSRLSEMLRDGLIQKEDGRYGIWSTAVEPNLLDQEREVPAA
jgi:hypothetical protein